MTEDTTKYRVYLKNKTTIDLYDTLSAVIQ